MTLTDLTPSPSKRSGRRYVRPPEPLCFPEGEDVGESAQHRKQLSALWQSVELELGDGALVCSDQFLYWDPTDPKKCLAPDLAVRVGTPRALPKTWKTWERGAPHVGAEIVSDWDRSEGPFARKLERYRQAGVAEVVRYDSEDVERPLRLWDLVDGDLVERDLESPDALYCDALALYWCIRQDPELGPMLWLARDEAGKDVLLTPAEAERAEKQAALVAGEAALARVAELEAELARKR